MNRATRLSARTFRKLRIVLELGGQCLACGYKKNLAALDVHHPSRELKDSNWANLIRRSRWDVVKKGLEGCTLLCRNCHMETHHPELSLDDTGELVDPKLKKRTGVCPSCGSDVFGLTYCSKKCDGLHRRKVKNRPSCDELKQMLTNETFVAIGKRFGVSDVAVHKWADKYGI